MALGYMRRHRRWLYVFLWLVIGAFIVLYIPAFQEGSPGGADETLAKVGGLPITVGEFQSAYQQRRQVYEQLYQGRLDDAALRSLGIEEQVFEGLVNERLVRLEASRLGLSVDDQTLARAIASAPDLARDGRFVGAAELRRLLQLQGVSLAQFEEQRRVSLLSERLAALVTDGVSVTPAEAEAEFRRRTEQLRAEYVWVDAARFRAELEVPADEVQARFEARRESYRFPERRVVSYLLLDPEPLRSQLTLTEADIQGYYEQHREEYKEQEQVCASHILVKMGGASDKGAGRPDAEARALAEQLLAKLRGGADFAETARAASEDEASAAAGGDLGCFPRGQMVPEFDNVAFDLEPGVLPEPVRTPFGYHVLRVQSRREETLPPLAQVKERVRQTLLAERMRSLLEQKLSAVSAALTRGRSLEDVAREQGLSVQQSAPLERGQGAEPLSSPVLAARAFELQRGEVDPEPFPLQRGWAFIALAEVQPPRLPELSEVQDRVRADLLEEKSLAQARAQALELKARAEAGGLEKAAAALGLVRKETPSWVGRGQALGDLPAGRVLDEAAYALPEKAISEPVRVEGGYAVLRVLERKAFDPAAFEAQRPALMASLREQKRERLFQAYLGEARRRFPVERRLEVFRRVLG